MYTHRKVDVIHILGQCPVKQQQAPQCLCGSREQIIKVIVSFRASIRCQSKYISEGIRNQVVLLDPLDLSCDFIVQINLQMSFEHFFLLPLSFVLIGDDKVREGGSLSLDHELKPDLLLCLRTRIKSITVRIQERSHIDRIGIGGPIKTV